MTTRPTPTGPHKLRATAHIRRLAQDVKRTFPDMDVHEHLTDAAREIEAGRHDNAKHHLDAAINAFAPLHITRHGIHDDTGHMAAKSFMQRAHRGRLLAADVEHISGANQELAGNRREAAATAAQEKAERQQMTQVQPAIPAGAKTMSWEDIDRAIELATFAGAKPGSGKNFAKLKGTLAKRGARNPGALAAYIGRKKYGAKKFGKMSHATPRAGGIELVGPKGYIHGWIRASAAALGSKMPHQMNRSEHRKAAGAHLRMMGQAPAGSDKARLHHKFAKLHAAASLRPAASYANPARGGIELVGPKGYSHGWVYHGRPGGGGPAMPGRFFMEGKQVSRHEYQQRMNEAAAMPGAGAPVMSRQKIPFSHAGMPARPPAGPAPPVRRVRGWVTGESAAKYHGQDGMRGDTGNGVVIGKYDHQNGTVTDRRGKVHHVSAIDPTAHEAGFKGDVASSHLPASVKQALGGYDRNVATGRIRFGREGFADEYPGRAKTEASLRAFARSRGQMSALTIQAAWEDILRAIELSADTGRLDTESHPFGKPGGSGLWGVKGMELPPYIQNIARALLRKGRAKSLSQAIAMAKGATARWEHGKNTRPEVRAASAETNASWAAKQARAHAHAGDQVQWMSEYLLTGTAAGAAKDPRIAAGAAGGGRFGSGGQAAGSTGSRSQRKARLLATAKQDRAKARLLAIRITAMRAALASASGKVSKGQKGAKTAAKRSTTGSTAPAAKGAAKQARQPSPVTAGQAAAAKAAATAQAAHMNKAQITAAIKTMTKQERNLLAAAVTASAQAAKL